MTMLALIHAICGLESPRSFPGSMSPSCGATRLPNSVKAIVATTAENTGNAITSSILITVDCLGARSDYEKGGVGTSACQYLTSYLRCNMTSWLVRLYRCHLHD